MSDEEVTVETTDGQILAAEYKDGQLQIVEVTPFDKDKEPGIESENNEPQKYMQVLDSNKGLMQLDLLNLTLVRCKDDSGGYQLVSEGNSDGLQSGAVTCVLQSSDNEDPDESYVMVESENGQGPIVFLKSTFDQATANLKNEMNEQQNSKALSPAEILERAKSLQKIKTAISSSNSRNRKRKCDLPPPHELLASPNFKLYLYSCKMCSFKCNAIKEMSAHKAAEHGSGSRSRSGRNSNASLQCARCPFRGAAHSQLMKHVKEEHLSTKSSNTVHLNTEEVEAADVLVCGACGFESSDRHIFKRHIEDEHGATTC